MMSELEKLVRNLMINSDTCSKRYLEELDENIVNQQKNLPEKVYKYLDFEGGCSSLESLTLQFSCPLSFYRIEHKLSDTSEFGIERVCIDNKLVRDLEDYIMSEGETGLKSLFSRSKEVGKAGFYVFRHFQTYLLGYGVCSLTNNPRNSRLWQNVSDHQGICVEYDRKQLLEYLQSIDKVDQFANVIYVDKLQKTPISFSDELKLKYYVLNLMFVKAKEFKFEEEFRIISRFENSSKNIDVEKFLKGEIGETPFRRYEISTDCINKVYYTANLENTRKLFDILEHQNICHQKINI